MKIILLIVIATLLAGCTQQICSEDTILVDGGCCLDLDKNGVCDSVENTQATPIQPLSNEELEQLDEEITNDPVESAETQETEQSQEVETQQIEETPEENQVTEQEVVEQIEEPVTEVIETIEETTEENPEEKSENTIQEQPTELTVESVFDEVRILRAGRYYEIEYYNQDNEFIETKIIEALDDDSINYVEGFNFEDIVTKYGTTITFDPIENATQSKEESITWNIKEKEGSTWKILFNGDSSDDDIEITEIKDFQGTILVGQGQDNYDYSPGDVGTRLRDADDYMFYLSKKGTYGVREIEEDGQFYRMWFPIQEVTQQDYDLIFQKYQPIFDLHFNE